MDELIDSMILDCNNAVKMILGGNYIAWCGVMQSLAFKLVDVKTKVQNEIKDRDDKIKTFERFVKDLNNGGADNGIQ